MNNWKQRLIAYISALDEFVQPEKADKLIHEEFLRIKEENANRAELVSDRQVDNSSQLDKPMDMFELITLYWDLFYGRQDAAVQKLTLNGELQTYSVYSDREMVLFIIYRGQKKRIKVNKV
jgi:hypothetical protein